MHSEDALSRLQDAAILWSVGSDTAADVIAAACDCLVAGVDSPTLRILAGISPAPEEARATSCGVGWKEPSPSSC